MAQFTRTARLIRCTFCEFYQTGQFRMRSMKEFEPHIHRSNASSALRCSASPTRLWQRIGRSRSLTKHRSTRGIVRDLKQRREEILDAWCLYCGFCHHPEIWYRDESNH